MDGEPLPGTVVAQYVPAESDADRSSAGVSADDANCGFGCFRFRSDQMRLHESVSRWKLAGRGHLVTEHGCSLYIVRIVSYRSFGIVKNV